MQGHVFSEQEIAAVFTEIADTDRFYAENFVPKSNGVRSSLEYDETELLPKGLAILVDALGPNRTVVALGSLLK